MGRLSKQVFGEVTGAVGHVVFKHRAGANYIAQRVDKMKASFDPLVLARRAKFALTGKIAQAINSIAVLKMAWPQSIGKLSRFNEIFQTNYKLIGSVANIGTVSVGPIFGFRLASPHLTTSATGVRLVADALGVNIGVDTGTEKYLAAAGVIVLTDPTQEGYPPTLVIPFKSIQQNLDLINPIDIAVELEGVGLVEYGFYTTRRAFGCLVTLDDNAQTVHASLSVQS